MIKVYNCNFITMQAGGPGTPALKVKQVRKLWWGRSPDRRVKRGVWVYACTDKRDNIPYGFIANESL